MKAYYAIEHLSAKIDAIGSFINNCTLDYEGNQFLEKIQLNTTKTAFNYLFLTHTSSFILYLLHQPASLKVETWSNIM